MGFTRLQFLEGAWPYIRYNTPNLWFDTDFIAVSIYRVEFDAANNHSFSPLCYHNKAMFYDCLEAVFNELKHKSCPQNWVILILMGIFNLAFSKLLSFWLVFFTNLTQFILIYLLRSNLLPILCFEWQVQLNSSDFCSCHFSRQSSTKGDLLRLSR